MKDFLNNKIKIGDHVVFPHDSTFQTGVVNAIAKNNQFVYIYAIKAWLSIKDVIVINWQINTTYNNLQEPDCYDGMFCND